MKITKRQLRRIIKEEKVKLIRDAVANAIQDFLEIEPWALK